MLVGAFAINQFITVAVYLQDIAERVFHIDHAIGLFAGVVVARFFHTAFATSLDDALGQPFNVRVLHTKVEDAGFPVLKVILWIFLVFKLKQLNADAITRG